MNKDNLLIILKPFRFTRNGSYSLSEPEIYYRFDEKDIYAILNEINELWLKMSAEKAELSAKVDAYEAIINNSNFKMAIVRQKKDEQ